jgi:hypothetical protein
MKQALIIAIAMASITAFAQTQTAPAAATTEIVAPATPTKKAKKHKATKKKATKPSAQAPAVTPVAPATTAAPAVAPATVAAPAAAGTSATSAAAPAAPTKKWGVGVVVDASNDYLTQGDIQALTGVSVSYKVTDKIKIKAGQTFESLTKGDDLKTDEQKVGLVNENNFRTAYTDMNVSTKLAGILGSDELAVSLNFKDINGNAIISKKGLGKFGLAQSIIEANLSIPYTLSPKWSVSIDTQLRHVASTLGYTENKHRIFAIPTASYTINDYVSLYQSAGMFFSFDQNTKFRNTYQRAYLATGVSLTPVKNLSIDLNVSQDKAVFVQSDMMESVTGFSLYQPTIAASGVGATFDAVGYEGVISYSF